MAMNGSGIRDTARVLKIDQGTVISTLKKKEQEIETVNLRFQTQPEIEVELRVI
jgi:transposase-like protein